MLDVCKRKWKDDVNKKTNHKAKALSARWCLRQLTPNQTFDSNTDLFLTFLANKYFKYIILQTILFTFDRNTELFVLSYL